MVRKLLILFLLLGSIAPLFAQQMKSMEFRDQDIRNVLMVLGELNNVSIVPDETVSGKISYYFASMDFIQALNLFFDANSLFYTKENTTYFVSKIKLNVNRDSKTIDLIAKDAPIQSIIRKVSTGIGKTILFDSLPNDLLSLNMEKVSYDGFLKAIIARLPDFSIEVQDSYYYLRKKAGDQNTYRPGATSKYFKQSGNNITVSIEKARFKELVIDLFFFAKKEYILLSERDSIIENLYLENKSFEDILRAILLLGGSDYNIVNNAYYISESQKKDIAKNYLITVIITLQHINVQELQRLAPASLANSGSIKYDEKTARVVVSGNSEEIKPIISFIEMVDRPNASQEFSRFDLKYIKTDELFPLLPQEIASLNPQALPGKSAFVITIAQSKRAMVEDLIALVDTPQPIEAIKLRYIKSEELLSNLPPSVSDGMVFKSKDPTIVYFKGTNEQRGRFIANVDVIDTPKPLVRYEILIVRYNDGNTLGTDGNVGIRSTSKEITTDKEGNEVLGKDLSSGNGLGSIINGTFSNLLKIDLDLVSDFGYTFSADIQSQIQNNKAKILTDTTLYGLSGEKLSLSNTAKYRYYTIVKDLVKGTETTAENTIESGLAIALEGWVSGDNMITIKIDSKITEQSSYETKTNGPSTNDKVILTTVRTKSGEPIVLSGLKEQKIVKVESKTPILGDIPVLGLLFKESSDQVEESEFVIYIIPHLEQEKSNVEGLDRNAHILKLRQALKI